MLPNCLRFCVEHFIINYNEFLVLELDDNEVYSFQVFSLSTSNYEAGSNEFEILTPRFGTIRIVTISVTTGLLILLAIVGVTLYMKRHLFTSYHNDEKI